MFYVFVLVIAALGVTIYLTVVLGAVPGAVDERLGRLEELPANLGEWVVDSASDEAERAADDGLVRETRILHEPGKGLLGRESFLLQVRYRERDGGKIVRVDPERRWTRRRKKV